MDNFISVFIVGVVVEMFLLVIMMNAKNMTYKDGQIDALTGKIEYHLITNPDSTKTWESIK